jgi:subtilase family serine protease
LSVFVTFKSLRYLELDQLRKPQKRGSVMNVSIRNVAFRAIRRLGCILPAFAAIAFLAAPACSQAQSILTHQMREAVITGQAQAIGRLPATQLMTLDLVLPLRDQAGLETLLRDIYDPASASYRHFLTVPEFTAKFGPTQADYDAVVQFAKSNGFAVIGGSRDGMEVQIRGPVSAINAAFRVTMRTYQHPTEARVFYAPDREPTTSLPFPLWHISGLDNFSLPHPLYVKKSDYAAAHGISPDAVVSHATTGSGPSSSFLGSDMRAAYYGGSALTGAGQNLGLFEYEGTDLADLTTYFKNVGQTNNVPVTLLSVDGTSTSCVYTRAGGDCDDGEQNLDMTQAIGMAPGLASLVMYIGSTDTAIISAMTTHSPLPTTIGCSWGWTPADPSTLDPYFQKMAAQGQNFFAASGDSSTWSKSNEAWPADDAYVVSVGGTDLVTASAAGPWKSETAWTDSGGGISPDSIAIPSWQQLSGVINSSNKGSTTLRNGPDVSANANFTFYTCDDQTSCLANEYGGTSFAAPMWAAYIALVNQQLVANGQPTIGFINPTIYAQNVTSSYTTDFHDITSGTSGSYSAVTGYDLVTGWGSPNAGLINALAGSGTQTPAFTLSTSPTSLSVADGSNGTSTITTTVSGGFDSAVALTASGEPTGVTVTFSPTSIAAPGSGTSTATVAVASSATAGTYTITVTGSGGGITHTATISLTVTATATPAFTLAASPTSVSVKAGSSGTSTITTTVSGGFSSAIALSASGQPTGVTASFSPTSIAAPGSGSSTLTLVVASTTVAGTYTITVTGTGGGITHTATVSLTVTAATSGTFAISVSPTSGYLDRGQSGYAVVTTTVSGGFSSAITLSATGVPSGVTYSFSPASIAAPGSGSSDFNLTVASNAPTGTSTITITGTGGGVTKTTTLTFQVKR